ncbi:MAG: DUF1028 domain-containing protein [Acidobacteriota bacterium]
MKTVRLFHAALTGAVLTWLLAANLEAAPLSGAGVRAADGVEVDAQGHPFYATFSLCAVDRATGETGVAVTTRVPFVGRAVPWVRAGVGAVATQSWTIVEYGRRGLDLLEQGLDPTAALAELLADDAGKALRQLGILDIKGRSAAHTGAENGAWAGSRQGADYTVQGNVLVGPQVVDAVADHFESTGDLGMPLAERMLLALEAGQAQGGDKRWGSLQSAAIRIADPNDSGRGGDHISLAIDVGEHERPVAEMKRIYYRTAGRLGHREFSQIQGSDVVELKRMLHRLGLYRQGLEAFPEPPKFDVERGVSRSDPEAFTGGLDAFRKLAREYNQAWAHYDDETMDAVDAFRKAHGLDHDGNPRGLVDARFVEALRAAYYERAKE